MWLKLSDKTVLKKKSPRVRRLKVLETHIQQEFVRQFKKDYPQYENIGYSIPNGGARTKSYGARLVAEGLVKGVPDWHLAVSNKKYLTLYLEFKSETGSVSPHQKLVIKDLQANGHKVEVIKTSADGMLAVQNYLAEV